MLPSVKTIRLGRVHIIEGAANAKKVVAECRLIIHYSLKWVARTHLHYRRTVYMNVSSKANAEF